MSEARAQTGQAWLPAQRREPAAAGPGVSTGLGSHAGPGSSTGPGSDTDRDADAGPDTGTDLDDSAGPGALLAPLASGRPQSPSSLVARRKLLAPQSRRRRALRLAADTRQAASGGRRAEAPHPGRHRRAPEARTSYREVFAVGEFRALFSAQVLSCAGDQFAQVA